MTRDAAVRVTQRARRIHEAFAAARTRSELRDFIGEAELYCAGSDCSVRYVTITVKEFYTPTPARLTCPACRAPLKLHHVRSLEEAEAVREREARVSVNCQIYRRDHPGEIAMPLSVFLNEALP
jgi:hypothetical protein